MNRHISEAGGAKRLSLRAAISDRRFFRGYGSIVFIFVIVLIIFTQRHVTEHDDYPTSLPPRSENGVLQRILGGQKVLIEVRPASDNPLLDSKIKAHRGKNKPVLKYFLKLRGGGHFIVLQVPHLHILWH